MGSKYILLLLILVGASNAYATESTDYTTISIIHPWSNGLHLRVTNGKNDPSSCGGGNGGFMLLSNNTAEYKLISSVILMAYAAKKTINIYTSGCISGGSSVIGAMAK